MKRWPLWRFGLLTGTLVSAGLAVWLVDPWWTLNAAMLAFLTRGRLSL